MAEQKATEPPQTPAHAIEDTCGSQDTADRPGQDDRREGVPQGDAQEHEANGYRERCYHGFTRCCPFMDALLTIDGGVAALSVGVLLGMVVLFLGGSWVRVLDDSS